MNTAQIVTWVIENIQLGDTRRSRALGEMAWGLVEAGVVSFAEIGRHLAGAAEAASSIRRVSRFCSNELVDPRAVQKALIGLLVGKALRSVSADQRRAMVAIDWHTYDNGEVSGLRVSLITGSRALPLLWREVKTRDLRGQQTLIEERAIRDLQAFRPAGVEWLMLLDSGFHSSELLDLLDQTGYFIVRSGVGPNVHRPGRCWEAVGKLQVELGELVEFGWVHWSIGSPRAVRLVAGRIAAGRTAQRGRRRAKKNSRSTRPGYCALVTNLSIENASVEDVLRLYGRRFEIEHSFRDIKNATLGMDMEHVHLREVASYDRLLCIVAIAEAAQWLMGAEAESRGLHRRLTPSRPKSGRRVLSLVNVGKRSRMLITGSIGRLICRHLGAAIVNAGEIVTESWRTLTNRKSLEGMAVHKEDLEALSASCRTRKTEDRTPCVENFPWALPTFTTPVASRTRVA